MVSILIDENLLLRSYQLEDSDGLYRAVDTNREHLRRWLQWIDVTTKPEHSHQFIQQSIYKQSKQEGLSLGIFYNQEIIGGIGMHEWDHYLQCGQLGYWIAKEYEGKGILSACLLRFVDFLFEKVELNKIEIRFVTQNIRSASVAERLGCKVEGILRQSIKVNGAFEDLVVSGLLRSEWAPLKENPAKQFKVS